MELIMIMWQEFAAQHQTLLTILIPLAKSLGCLSIALFIGAADKISV